MLNSAQVVVDRANLWLAHCGHICIAHPRGETDMALMTDINRGFNILAKRAPTGVGLLMIIGAGSPAPMGEVREAAVRMFTDFQPKLKIMAAYIEGSGFIVAAKRAVFTFLISRFLKQKPVKTFSDLAKATEWLETQARAVGLECPTSEELQLLLDRSVAKK